MAIRRKTINKKKTTAKRTVQRSAGQGRQAKKKISLLKKKPKITFASKRKTKKEKVVKRAVKKSVAKKSTEARAKKIVKVRKVVKKKVMDRKKAVVKKSFLAGVRKVKKKAIPKKVLAKKEVIKPNEKQLSSLVIKGRSRGFITETELLYVFPEVEEYTLDYELFLD